MLKCKPVPPFQAKANWLPSGDRLGLYFSPTLVTARLIEGSGALDLSGGLR
jgi:hypothetical protein